MSKMNFAIEKFEVSEQKLDPHLAKVKFYVCRSGNNSHGIPITKEAILKAKESLVCKPVLANYISKINDLGGHDPEEIPVGVFLKEDEMHIEEIDGELWIIADAYIWKFYFPEIMEVLSNNDGENPVSMEIELIKMNEGIQGNKIIEEFSFTGVTILGKTVAPAIKKARTEVLQYADLVKEIRKFANYSVGEELGKGNKIEILLGKEDAVKSGAWRDPSATLLNKLLKASNHASLVKESYLIVDGDSNSDLAIGEVHYPHHVIRNGKLVVHQRGVQAAFSRAKQQGLTGVPISHIKKHYTELGLNEENFAKFELTYEEYDKYFSEKEDTSLNEDVKKEEFEEVDMGCKNMEEPKEEEVKEEVFESESEEKKEDPEEEKTETPEEEKKEDEEEKFSSDANSENVVPVVLNEKDDETAKEMSLLKAENESLKGKIGELEMSIALMAKEKEDFEARQYSANVEFALAEASEDLTIEKTAELRDKSKEFNFSTFGIFANLVKSEAYESSKTKGNKPAVQRFADPHFTPAPESGNDCWSRYINKSKKMF